MVGTTGRTSSTDYDGPSFSQSLHSLLHTDRYEAHVVLDSPEYSVGFTAYPEYPIRTYEDDDYWVCLEGRVYDHDCWVERELLALADHVLNPDVPTDPVTDWLLETDGEFVVVAYEKDSGRLALFNDVLSRLPLYYYHDGDTFAFSRELRYLVDSLDLQFDPMGVAQCLLLGYPLGNRTLMHNVERLRPATALTFDPADGTVANSTLHTFSFEENAHADRGLERNAAELVSRFETACRNRSGYDEHDVISLSGGLDSRSVLAGYHREGLPVSAATMASEEYVPPADVEIARQLTDAFDVDWQTYRVDHPNGADLETLVKTKNGQIGLLTSFILDFFRQLQDEYGPSISYVTGDGGDKVLPDLTPSRSLDDDELVDYIVRENSFVPLEQVASITDLSAEWIRESIRDHVREYPEDDPDAKYVHYLVYERGANFLFEGEDRNRFFFWSVTPFYSLPFFRYAMNCPSEQKARYKLYRSFLERLAPEAAQQVHPDYGVPVSSTRHTLAAFADDFLSRYPRAFETVKPVVKSVNGLDTESRIEPDTIDCIRHQIEQCEAVDEVLSTEELHRILESYTEHERSTIYRIFTLTSVIDDVRSSRSVLETRRGVVFG